MNMNESFVRAKKIFDDAMEESLAKYNPGGTSLECDGTTIRLIGFLQYHYTIITVYQIEEELLGPHPHLAPLLRLPTAGIPPFSRVVSLLVRVPDPPTTPLNRRRLR